VRDEKEEINKIMKITICGSITFGSEMLEAKEKLEVLGHEVKIPQIVARNDAWTEGRKGEAIKKHFEKVEWSDAILVMNHDKREIEGYIGANTLMEMGLAFYLGKKIYLIKDVPNLSYKDEIVGMNPIILSGELEQIIL
jgi:hypothetical protein